MSDETANDSFLRMILQLISFFVRHSFDSIRGTHPRNLTFITVLTEVLLYLQEQRTIAEGGASLYALTTTRTETFIDSIFEIWFLHELARDGTRRTELVLGSCIQILHTWTIVATAEIAIATHTVSMEAFHRRYRKHTVGLTPSTLGTGVWVNLPEGITLPAFSFGGKYTAGRHTYACYQQSAAFL